MTPLLFYGHHDGESYAVQFPLFFHSASQRQGTSTTITPLGFVERDRDGTSVAVGPIIPLVYWRIGHDRSHFALLPLFWYFADRAADKSTTVIGPYWHRRWGGETTDGLFPLLYYRRGARPGGDDETSLTVFPLFYYRRDAETHLFASLLGASVRGPHAAAGSSVPTAGSRTATSTPASCRSSTPTSCAAPTAST